MRQCISQTGIGPAELKTLSEVTKMFELVEITKNTRGRDSREVTFHGIGVWKDTVIEREKDEAGNDLGKDADGKQITRKETVKELVVEGVLPKLEDAMELCRKATNGDEKAAERLQLDCFSYGYNDWAFSIESDKDELTPYLTQFNDEQRKAIRRGVNAFASAMSLDKVTALKRMLNIAE